MVLNSNIQYFQCLLGYKISRIEISNYSTFYCNLTMAVSILFKPDVQRFLPYQILSTFMNDKMADFTNQNKSASFPLTIRFGVKNGMMWSKSKCY